jgi:hypothetical protein
VSETRRTRRILDLDEGEGVSIKAKRRKAVPARAETEQERFAVFEICRDEIRRMAKEGFSTATRSNGTLPQG